MIRRRLAPGTRVHPCAGLARSKAGLRPEALTCLERCSSGDRLNYLGAETSASAAAGPFRCSALSIRIAKARSVRS